MPEDERIIYDKTNKRRVRIYQRTDGAYSFVEEKFSDEPLEQCWLPQTWRRSIPICDSFEIALREAKGRVDWLAEST